jgi:hypothetical protein
MYEKFQSDFSHGCECEGENDLWYFPSGLPHSIQGLESDGAEFMLVFDDGDFSESDTALLSDSMAHISREVLSKNFGIAEEAFKDLPRNELFIFQTEVSGPLEADQEAAAGTLGKSPSDFAFRTMEMPPTKRTKGGEVRIVESSKFKVSTATIRTFRSEWLAHTPPELVMAHLRIDRATLDAIPKDEVVVNSGLVDNFEACTDGAKAFPATQPKLEESYLLGIIFEARGLADGDARSANRSRHATQAKDHPRDRFPRHGVWDRR